MKRKRLDPEIVGKARKVASVVGAVHALLQSIEKNFAESDVDDDENFELMAVGTYLSNDADDNDESAIVDVEDGTAATISAVAAAADVLKKRRTASGYHRQDAAVPSLSFVIDSVKLHDVSVDVDVEETSGDEKPINGQEVLKVKSRGESTSKQQQQPGDESSQEILLLFSLDDFRKQFGVQQRTFEVIGQLVAPYTEKASTRVPGRAQIPAEKQLLISLWLLVNQESFKDVGARFAVCRKTAWQCLHRVVRSLVKINQERSVIQWPSLERSREIIDGFHELSGFSSVMGVIDSVHIPIKAPPVAPDVYANPKGFHSVILQAVCDSKMQFIDCYIGEGGSTDDAVVLSRSPLQQIMCTPPLFPSNCHLIGDSVYPLQTHLLTAYDENVDSFVDNNGVEQANNNSSHQLTEPQRRFNECVGKCLSVINRTFAALKGRFRRLRKLEMSRVDKIPETIMACCVLHNISLQLDDAPDETDLVNISRDDRPATVVLSEEREEAIVKREEVARTLNSEYKS